MSTRSVHDLRCTKITEEKTMTFFDHGMPWFVLSLLVLAVITAGAGLAWIERRFG